MHLSNPERLAAFSKPIMLLLILLMISVSAGLAARPGEAVIAAANPTVALNAPQEGGCQQSAQWLLDRPFFLVNGQNQSSGSIVFGIGLGGGEKYYLWTPNCTSPCTPWIDYGDCWWHVGECGTDPDCDPQTPEEEWHKRCAICCTGEAWCHECNPNWWTQVDTKCVGCN